MTQEEKQLLFKDLCTRLPYGVRVKELESIKELEFYLTSIYHDIVQVETMTGGKMACSIEAIKPYLRPMSSMTEEEKEEFESVLGHYDENNNPYEDFNFGDDIDWLNAHHFDYRGLIEKGLALEAPEDMYGKKNDIMKK